MANKFLAVPEYLKKQKRWCLYNKKKCPLSIDGHALTKERKESELASFEEAVAELEGAGEQSNVAGIGFVFADEPNGLVGIDFDDCFTDNGTLKKWAEKILDRFPGGYLEKSPSGTGLHLYVLGRKAGEKCKKIIATPENKILGEVEVYSHGRYFTVTGNPVDAKPQFTDVIECQESLDWLYKTVIDPEYKASDTPPAAEPKKAPVIKSAQDLRDIIETTKQAEKFQAFFTRPLSEIVKLYQNDISRAVYAFSAIVAFYTEDFSLCDSLIRESVLWQHEKWSEGKWARLGEAQFNNKRKAYERKGDIYSVDHSTPEEDFGQPQANRMGELDFEKHIDLLWIDHSEVRRDLLTESLHAKERTTGKWVPVWTKAKVSGLKGEALVRGKGYKKSRIEDYLYRYEKELPPRMLIDIPKWDGVDRIERMGGACAFRDVDTLTFIDFFKDWAARMWQRIENPQETQNRCLILSGRQGIGKDVFVQSAFGAMNKYMADLTLAGKFSKETDIAVVMGSSLIMFISEFDKTDVLGIETLKDLITKPSFSFVRKYDRDMTTLLNRCSVIAACNPEHVLRDVTGNRRFLVFRLDGGPREAILWDAFPAYNKDWSLQIISQSRELAYQDYHASRDSEALMASLTSKYQADDTESEIVVDFEVALESREANIDPLDPRQSTGLFRLSEIEEILGMLARSYGESRKAILAVLKSGGCRHHTRIGCYYGRREVIKVASKILNSMPSKTPSEEDFM